MTRYSNLDIIEMPITTKCFRCRTEINTENQIYYVFIGMDAQDGNEPFCCPCYFEDIQAMSKLDPFHVHIYHKNFIRMNK